MNVASRAVVGVLPLLGVVGLLAVDKDAVGRSPSAALPPPVLGQRVNLSPVSGRVSVRLPGQADFIRLSEPRQVPVRTVVDTRRSGVRLVSARNSSGGTQRARVSEGIFEVRQARSGMTTFILRGGPTVDQCKAARGARSSSLARKLRQHAKGKYRTRSSGVANTVRGTSWKMIDTCGEVTTDVFKGSVVVENFVRRTRRVLRCATVRGGQVRRRRLRACARFRTRGRYSAATIRGG